MSLRIVIVGGVAGGAGAAAKARRVNEQAEIVLFERGPYISFANCGLPYYVGDRITDRQSLLLQSPESFWKRFRIRAHVRHEVQCIDRSQKQIEVKNLQTNEVTRQPYDKLILAPGAGAIVPPLSGIGSPNIFTVKTVPDSDAIRAFITEHQPTRAVVVGAGFIGLESAEALKGRGLSVTVVERLPQVLPPFDPDMAVLVAHHLEEQGIRLILSDGIRAFHGNPLAQEVELQSGRRIPADLVILSIGVRPEVKLAQDAGLKIGKAGGIDVNEFQQTSDPDIYAAGDAVEVVQRVTGQKTRFPLAGPANKEGRVAGANAAGGHLRFPGVVGTAIVEAMGITAAKTGLSEREAQQAGLQTLVSVTHSLDHAGYYPGGELLHMKLLSEQGTGRLLGAQIVGKRGVDKRIDVLATGLAGGMTVTDLENLDLAYAPQFSSAKDPVNMAGFVAANISRQETATVTCADLQKRIQAKELLQLVDVRTPEEFSSGHLETARNLPLDELRERLAELDAHRPTVVYCRVGFRGYLAACILRQNGFGNVRNLTGGLLICPEAGHAAPPSSTAAMIPVSVLRQVLDGSDAVVLDIREPDEYAYEHIVATRMMPLSRLAESLSSLPKEKDLYVFCQTGIRTPQAVAVLRAEGFKRIHAVDGGIDAWKAAGFAVQRASGPIPIMRQVQIAAGSLVLVGGLVPGFRWVAIVVGVGLVFAGVSGRCGMAAVLTRMPWNKSGQKGKPSGKTCSASCS